MPDARAAIPLPAPSHPVQPHHVSTGRRWLRFTRHFVVMLLAMYAGMLVLYPVYSLTAGRLGYSDPVADLPVLSSIAMAVTMTVPMVALMWWHRYSWRPMTEMAAAMTVPTLAATALSLAGAISAASVMSVSHLAMIPAMLAVMLFRFDEYAGGHAHHR